jgi:hypothetical protein
VKIPGTVGTGASGTGSWAVTEGDPIPINTAAITQTSNTFKNLMGFLLIESILVHEE